CSTPTHAAEAAVPVDCGAAREQLRGEAARLESQGRRAIVERARMLARLSRAPADHVDRHRARLHQQTRELRAGARRVVANEHAHVRRAAGALERTAAAAALAVERATDGTGGRAAALARDAEAARSRRARELERLRLALAAHDPQRTLERGYALVEDAGGRPVTSAAAARGHGRLVVRMHDGRVPVRPDPPVP
ncbi:MAG: exodeoxyribonuclease VII large subunit, partial [Solirubrobacteraceae bacterium]